jgi:predicted amidohydrolase YtcJ
MRHVAALLLLMARTAAARAGEPAERLFLHGDILTGEALTSQPRRVAALAVRGERVLLAGSDEEVTRLAGPATEIVDLHGAFVMPGFNDAHVHLAAAGALALACDLRGAASLEEMLARVQRSAARATPGAWIRGGGWDHMLWSPARLPSRADLDRVTGDHPALLERVDGHIGVTNSAALRSWGIDRTSADPPGGKIDRDAAGEPTGILRDTAMQAYAARIPPPAHADRRRALELATADAVREGVTSVQDYSSWHDFLVYEEMEREGKLPLRVSEWLSFDDPPAVLIRERDSHPHDDPMLHTGMLKGFMDGSLGSRTAALNAPYSDEPNNRGLPRYEQARLDRMTVERARLGFQIGFHAIGDRAVSMALHAFAAAEAALPPAQGAQLRFRIEHDQVIAPADLERQAVLNVIASMQPSHVLTDMRWAAQRLGPVRARYSYAWKSMLDHGIALAFGTDYPIESVRPLRGLYAAVTRLPEPAAAAAAAQPYFPEERLSIAEALYAYTQGSAYAEGMEALKGRLVSGQLADFVVLDRDLLGAAPREILNARVLRTVVGGRTVFESKPHVAQSR